MFESKFPVHIFETCVFDHHDNVEVEFGDYRAVTCHSEVVERYSSLGEARKGHKRWVKHFKEGGSLQDIDE